ncbi:MAG TPA: phosphoribosylanthranilate isomerase [Acidimicrobiia bacterium]|nr:phosphoribosylanthranilate isomerase [Acidimicrobiia bacterium]
MTWVKICGLTRQQDVGVAEEAGADAVGFVLVPESPRALTVSQAAALASRASVTRIILTRDLEPEALLAATLAIGADGVQPYGQHQAEAAQAAAETGLMVLRPVPVAGPLDFREVPSDQIPLLDHASSDALGGTGRGFDYSLLPATDRKFVLAGGLGPDNVAAAITATRPYGVDASSRLEIRPGEKDPRLVTEFIAQVKQR